MTRDFLCLKNLAFKGGTCHKHSWEFACHIILPKCDPLTKQVIYPCREMCWSFVNGCREKIRNFGNLLSTRSVNISELVNCNYLPSINDSIPCFYKPVTCDPAPDVTNGTRILNTTQKETYELHDAVTYACINETFKMVGNKSVSCLYSGEWSTPNICDVVKEAKNSVMNPLYIVLPILLAPLLIPLVIVVVKNKWKRKTLPDLREGRIQFDNTLIQLTENNEPLLS